MDQKDQHNKFGKPLSDTLFCALDLETTGTNPVLHNIIEVGAVKFNLSKRLETFHSLIDPQCLIPEQAQEIHGISDDMVANAPRINTILGELLNFIKDTYLVIHNAQFDLAFLANACLRANIPVPKFKYFDTVHLSRKTFDNVENYRLGTLCKSLNIDTNFHRAEGDAFGAMEIFRNILKKKDPSSKWKIEDLKRYHGHGDTIRMPRSIKRKGSNPILKKLSLKEKNTIDYCNASGEILTRTILPFEIIQYGRKKYIRAFCYLRDEERYFRLNRIKRLY